MDKITEFFGNILGHNQEEYKTEDRLNVDSLGKESWRLYLDVKRLRDAWAPPAGSPYSTFAHTRTIDGLESVIRDQRSEIRDQRSEIRDQRSEIRDQAAL